MVGPQAGGLFNVPAALITLLVTALLSRGARESAAVNVALVAIKLLALGLFVVLTITAIKPAHFTPFAPYGFAAHVVDGRTRGVMAAAAIVFFAFFGFDAVSTSAEEVKRPERDLAIGIMGSMVASTLIYMVVAACAVGAWPFADFAKSGEPLAFILRGLGHPLAAFLIGVAAIIALPSVILVMMFGQTRVFFVMARDGLLPQAISRLHPKRGAPVGLTIGLGLAIALVAGLFPLAEIAELSNAGTLLAFITVALSVMVLRAQRPDLPRLFRCPQVWIVAPLAVVGCLYFMASLPAATLIRFVIWNVVGIGVYLSYGRRRSVLAGGDMQSLTEGQTP
jgi:APA family basic amino acid/polyamine antiporter